MSLDTTTLLEYCKKAFHEVKEAISATLILLSLDYSKYFQIFSFALEDTIA
jgi:hypothetical protein